MRSVGQPPSPDLFAQWEARLAAEGLAPVGGLAYATVNEGKQYAETLGDRYLREKLPEENAVARDQVEALLKRLPVRYQEVVELRLQGLTWRGAAARCNPRICYIAFRWRYHRALEAMRILAEHPAPSPEALAKYEPRPHYRRMIERYLACWNCREVADELGERWHVVYGHIVKVARTRPNDPIAKLILALPYSLRYWRGRRSQDAPSAPERNEREPGVAR